MKNNYARSVFVLLMMAAAAGAQTKLTLREALDAAAKQNPDVLISRLSVVESEAAVMNARSRYMPQLNAVVTAAYQTTNLQGIGLAFPGFGGRLGPFRTFNARPVLTQTILDLRLVSEIRAAKQRAAAGKFDAEAVKETTQLAVTELYLQAAQAQSRISAAEARLRTAEAVLKQARDLEAAGTSSKLDVARAEQQYHTEHAAVITAKRDLETLTTLLLRTVGMGQGSVELAFEPAAKVGDVAAADALTKAMETRAELKAADVRIRVGVEERTAAERDRYPRLTASGDFGLSGAGPDRSLSTYTTGVTLSVPVFTGGRIRSEIDAAKARIDRSKEERRAMELRIAQEVKQATVEAAAAREALTDAERGVAAARTTLELAQVRFQTGLGTNIDTVTAQGTLAASEDFEIRTRYDYLLAMARLARASGDVGAFVERWEGK